MSASRALLPFRTPPPDRGRLLSPLEVSRLIGRSPDWCKANLPYKVRLGHRSVGWFELDVRAWLETRRAAD